MSQLNIVTMLDDLADATPPVRTSAMLHPLPPNQSLEDLQHPQLHPSKDGTYLPTPTHQPGTLIFPIKQRQQTITRLLWLTGGVLATILFTIATTIVTTLV